MFDELGLAEETGGLAVALTEFARSQQYCPIRPCRSSRGFGATRSQCR